MSNKRSSALVAIGVIVSFSPACSDSAGKATQGGDLKEFVESLCGALLTADEKAWVRLHLMPGDTTRDGRGILMTDLGGKSPDEKWSQNVAGAYTRALGQVEELEKMAGPLSCGGLLAASDPVESLDGYTREALFEVHGEQARYAIRVGSSRGSQRGRIGLGDPSISVLYWKEYQEKYAK